MSATEVAMVGHASAVFRHGHIAILSDPWFSGAIFNESWDLLSPPCQIAIDGVTHIWISHEHPDHFHLPTLRKLLGYVGPVPVLVQWQPSSTLGDALRCLGYPVIELQPDRWTRLSGEVEVLSHPSRRIDSLLAVRTPSATVVNLNDCKLSHRHAAQVARTVGRPDLLLAQFSIANWPGNSGTAPREDKRYRVARRTRGYTQSFQPKRLLLFGSFARFCHVENEYVNEWVLSPAEAEAYLRENCLCPVSLLYPGDHWSSASGIMTNGDAAERYACDLDAAHMMHQRTSSQVPIELILHAAGGLHARLSDCFSKHILRSCPPVIFHLQDTGEAICMDIANGRTTRVDAPRSACHIALHSQVLWYSLAHRWGFDTLDISARFELLRGDKNQPAFGLCDACSVTTNLRPVSRLTNVPHYARFMWSKRGEFIDLLETRLLGRTEL